VVYILSVRVNVIGIETLGPSVSIHPPFPTPCSTSEYIMLASVVYTLTESSSTCPNVLATVQSPYVETFKEPRNRFRRAGNRFLGSLKGLQIRAQNNIT
jgi:hypothetical protein